MSLHGDYVLFVDGNSKVPYHMEGAFYSYKPNIYTELFIFEMKEYYHSYNKYYVGIGASKFVRPISASEFNMVKVLYKTLCDSKISKKVQLSFEL